MGQSLFSFLLPTPLMEPENWPALDEAARWLLPLDVAIVAGGPLKKRFEDLLERDRVAWYLPSDVLKAEQTQKEIRLSEITGWLQTFPGARCYSDDPELFASMPIPVLMAPEFERPTLLQWASEIFPKLKTELGNERLRAEIESYARKLPGASLFPWEDLRFFAGSLRQSGRPQAVLAALEWARFQALFSPQNEEVEARRLSTDSLILNPTAQILRSNHSSLVTVVLRWNDRLQEEQIGWREAYLIDEVSETPNLSVNVLLRAADTEASSLNRVFEKTADAERATSFREALDFLTGRHVLLRGL